MCFMPYHLNPTQKQAGILAGHADIGLVDGEIEKMSTTLAAASKGVPIAVSIVSVVNQRRSLATNSKLKSKQQTTQTLKGVLT
jgi:hypothetical protein